MHFAVSWSDRKCWVQLLGQQNTVSWQREHQLTLHCLPTSRNALAAARLRSSRVRCWRCCAGSVGANSEECHWQLSITQHSQQQYTARLSAPGNAAPHAEGHDSDFTSSLTLKGLCLPSAVKALRLSWIWNKRENHAGYDLCFLVFHSCEWDGCCSPQRHSHVFTLQGGCLGGSNRSTEWQ